MTEVTEADCEAAAELIEHYWSDGSDDAVAMRRLAQSYRAGHTQGVWAHAFARHREAAELRGKLAMREAAKVTALSEKVDVSVSDDKHSDLAYNLACDHIADAIAAIDPAQVRL